MKTYKVTGYRTEKYDLWDIKARSKSEAIEKFNDFVEHGADWEPSNEMKYKVEITKDS